MPDLIAPADCMLVAEALQLALKEESRSPYCSAAAEILGRGFTVWAPHINGSSILRSLIKLTGISTSAPVISKSVSEPSRSTHSTATISVPVNSSANLSSILVTTARQAVVLIASTNSGLFATTLCFDLQHNKSVGERTILLKLLGMFISKVGCDIFLQSPRNR